MAVKFGLTSLVVLYAFLVILVVGSIALKDEHFDEPRLHARTILQRQKPPRTPRRRICLVCDLDDPDCHDSEACRRYLARLNQSPDTRVIQLIPDNSGSGSTMSG